MNLQYTISHDQYNDYQRELRKIKSKKPLNIFFTIIMAIMPVALVIYLIFQGVVSGILSAILIIAAVALGIMNFILRTNLWENGKFRLDFNFTKKQKQLTEEFWKEHHLCISNTGISLKCGAYKNECSWVSFGGFKKYGDILVPIFNAAPFDLIPSSALEQYGGEEKFKQDFIDIAKTAMRSECESARNNPPKNADIKLQYRYPKARYIEDQVDARRKKYTTKLIFNKVFFAKLALSGVMIYLISTAESIGAVILYLALIVVFNYEHISTFSPILKKRLETQLLPILVLKPDTLVDLYVVEEGIVIIGDIHYIELPWEEICEVRRTKHALAFYLASQTILTVPDAPENDAVKFNEFCDNVLSHRV